MFSCCASTQFSRFSILEKSLSYITARQNNELIGFCNVAWDGGRHATIFDVNVHPKFRRQGVALAMMEPVPKLAKTHGVKYLHVDFDQTLEPLYSKVGFEMISAGIIFL